MASTPAGGGTHHAHDGWVDRLREHAALGGDVLHDVGERLRLEVLAAHVAQLVRKVKEHARLVQLAQEELLARRRLHRCARQRSPPLRTQPGGRLPHGRSTVPARARARAERRGRRTHERRQLLKLARAVDVEAGGRAPHPVHGRDVGAVVVAVRPQPSRRLRGTRRPRRVDATQVPPREHRLGAFVRQRPHPRGCTLGDALLGVVGLGVIESRSRSRSRSPRNARSFAELVTLAPATGPPPSRRTPMNSGVLMLSLGGSGGPAASGGLPSLGGTGSVAASAALPRPGNGAAAGGGAAGAGAAAAGGPGVGGSGADVRDAGALPPWLAGAAAAAAPPPPPAAGAGAGAGAAAAVRGAAAGRSLPPPCAAAAARASRSLLPPALLPEGGLSGMRPRDGDAGGAAPAVAAPATAADATAGADAGAAAGMGAGATTADADSDDPEDDAETTLAAAAAVAAAAAAWRSFSLSLLCGRRCACATAKRRGEAPAPLGMRRRTQLPSPGPDGAPWLT